MTTLPAGYSLSDDKMLLQLDVIHGFLASSYWSPGIPIEIVRRAIDNSMTVGVYRDEPMGRRQVGFARLITDRATFAYLADVFVVEEARGLGLSKAIVAYFVGHPELQNLRRWMLATRDAHGLYRQFGFEPVADPDRLMMRHDPDVYKRLARGDG